jgi:cobalamin biosynthesis protein CobT
MGSSRWSTLRGGGTTATRDDSEYSEEEYDDSEEADDDSEEEEGESDRDEDAYDDDEEEEEEDESSDGRQQRKGSEWGILESSLDFGSLTSRLQGLSVAAETKARSALRDAKGLFSSDYEVLLLQATTPSDDEVPAKQLVDKVLVTVGTFARSLDVKRHSNPYRTTLRKLWSKLKEKNWRTTLKVLALVGTAGLQQQIGWRETI